MNCTTIVTPSHVPGILTEEQLNEVIEYQEINKVFLNIPRRCELKFYEFKTFRSCCFSQFCQCFYADFYSIWNLHYRHVWSYVFLIKYFVRKLKYWEIYILYDRAEKHVDLVSISWPAVVKTDLQVKSRQEYNEIKQVTFFQINIVHVCLQYNPQRTST